MSKQMLAQLNEKRSQAHARAETLTNTARAESRNLTSQEAAEFDQLMADISSIKLRADEIRSAEARDQAVAANLARIVGPGGVRHHVGDPQSFVPSHREYAELVAETRVLGYGGAGAVLPTDTYGQWFDRMRNRSVVLAASPLLIDVPHHALSVPVLTSSVTIGTYAENTTITASDPTFAAPTLTPVKFAGLVGASNEAFDDSNPDLRAIIETDMINQIATAVDTELLIGSGASNRIRGLRNVTGATVVSSPTNGAVPTPDTVLDLIANLEGLGANLDTIAIFLTPQIWSVLRKAKDNTGRYLVGANPQDPTEQRLFGVRVFPTANLPQTETQGTSNVTSTIIAADMSRIAVGVGKDVRVQMSEDFAFDKDQTWLRVTGRFDLAALNANAVALAVGNKVA